MSYTYMAHRRARASRGRRADARGSASAQPDDVATMAFILGGFSHIFAFKGAFQAEVRDGNNISRVFERARATDAARARDAGRWHPSRPATDDASDARVPCR